MTTNRYALYRRLRRATRFSLLVLALVVFLFPFYWMLKTSFEPTSVMYRSVKLIPPEFTLAHYRRALTRSGFVQPILNSLVVAIGTTVVTTLMSLIGAYSVLRYQYPGRKAVTRTVLIIYMFPHVALLVPVYNIASTFNMLGNPIALIVMHTMLALPFCMWILQSFLVDIPREQEEAAMVEGASEFGAFMRITVPQAMPGILAAGTFAFILSWGEYTFSFLLVTDSANFTVPVALNNLLGAYAINWGLLAAASVLATLPVLAIFWVMAKYLGEGIAKGTGAI